MNSIFIDLSFVEQVNSAVMRFVTEHGDFFHDITRVLLVHFLVPLEKFLLGLPPLGVLMAIGALAWHALRRWGIVLALVAGLYLIGCFGLWDKLMQTLALMLVSTTLTVALGLPLGIWMSSNARLRRVLEPVLDVMQTLPTFVYLVPVLMLFGLGKVPAVLATVIYALPPLVRLTDLGIRQVDKEVVEASRSFGATPWQLLVDVNLPWPVPASWPD